MHATQHVCAAVAIELWDVVAPHGLVRPGALSDTAIAVVLVSTIPLRMTCATLHRHLWPCRNNQRVAQQPHCPQRSPRLLRAFHELSEPAVHVAMLVALFERMLRCCINILIISYILHLYLQLIYSITFTHVCHVRLLNSPQSLVPARRSRAGASDSDGGVGDGVSIDINSVYLYPSRNY